MVVVLLLLAVSFSEVLAAPWNNPNGTWIYDVECEGGQTFDVWVANNNTKASFTSSGEVGIMKALYINFGSGYELIWQIPGKGEFKNTTWCTWVFEGMDVGGEVMIP